MTAEVLTMDEPKNEALTLFCELQREPLAVEDPRPRFSWRRAGHGMQRAYRLRVYAVPPGAPAETGAPVWDSGEVCSVEDKEIRCGVSLIPCARYAWTLDVTETDGTTHRGRARFATGLMAQPDRVCWIGAKDHVRGVTDLVRQEVSLDAPPADARLFIGGVGLYEVHINGRRPAGDGVLEPAWTDYRYRVMYRSFDVAEMLHEGENVLGIELGEGWYGHEHPSFTRFMGHQPEWLGDPAVWFMLWTASADGTQRVFSAGDGGAFTMPGAVIGNSIYDGEVFDARRVVPGWDLPGAMPDGFSPAAEVEGPAGRLCAQQMPPMRIMRRIPVELPVPGEGPCVLDTRQNIAGWLQITVRGTSGSRVELRYAETLAPDGSADQAALRGAQSRDVYILRGGEAETWHARFTYHGFRYVQVLTEGEVQLLCAEAHGVWTDVPEVGRFSSGEPLLDDIMRAVQWTERNNMPGLPTDCPQRDERMAWLNDVTVRCEEALYNFDLRLFYEKWLDDIADAQAPSGSLPDTAPHVYCGNPAFHISSCYVLIPWLLYRYYGDRTPMERHFDRMVRYVRFLASQRGADGLIGAPYFGEWAPPAAECDQSSPWSAEPINIPPPAISTGYLAFDCRLMRKIAAAIGRREDDAWFAATASEAEQAINAAYYDPEEGYYRPGSQGANIFPLLLGFSPDPARTAAHLLEDLSAHGMHMTTGNQMTKWWFPVLDRIGRSDIALRLALTDTYPSLGFMLRRGATTIWERWEELQGDGMNSHDHPMNAAYTVWYYQTLAGIRRDDDGTLVLSPAFWLDIDAVDASTGCAEGEIRSAFRREPDGVRFTFTVPWNTTARIVFPADRITALDEDGQPVWREGEPTADGRIVLTRLSGEYRFFAVSAGKC